MQTPKPRLFLGVDGGGTKTEFILIDAAGQLLARHQTATSYYLQIGLDGLRDLLRDGVAATLAAADTGAEALTYAFFGLPAYGEDSAIDPRLDTLPETILGHRRYRCGNDMICGWAGSLGGADGINIVAGTGSIAYGERLGVAARCGGWGELFGDEGSAYWIAIQGLNAFSRMSDRRAPRGPLYELLKTHFALKEDLDLCARMMGEETGRNRVAALSQLVARAAGEDDAAAIDIFARAAGELAAMIEAIRRRIGYGAQEAVSVSYSGGVFRSGETILRPLRQHLTATGAPFRLTAPLLPPGIGAAIYAARLSETPLAPQAIQALQSSPLGTPARHG